jgi:hypothetical protein
MYLRVVKFPGRTALAILERPLGTTIQQSHESGHVLVSTIIMNEDKRAVKPSGCHFGSVLSDDVKGGSANVERLISSAKVSEICPGLTPSRMRAPPPEARAIWGERRATHILGVWSQGELCLKCETGPCLKHAHWWPEERGKWLARAVPSCIRMVTFRLD